jgi:CubicO group peptidase (beta-lactamase class C family)
VNALDAVAGWPVPHAAAAVASAGGVLRTAGDTAWVTAIASVTKPLVAYACLVAVEEQTLALDAPAGPEGSTVRHLLAHASGLPFEGAAPIAPPGTRRIYSNTGFALLGRALAEAAGMDAADYVAEAVFQPLGMAATELRGGDTGAGVWSSVDDLAAFARELLRPTLVAPATLADAVTEQFPGLAGVVPGFGAYDPNPWGLGFELKGAKSPHWTAPGGSPRTFGHFGGAGTFLWVDPDAALACVVLTDRGFGEWAPPLWTRLSADVLAEAAAP